jgi:hypothetical protein
MNENLCLSVYASKKKKKLTAVGKLSVGGLHQNLPSKSNSRRH